MKTQQRAVDLITQHLNGNDTTAQRIAASLTAAGIIAPACKVTRCTNTATSHGYCNKHVENTGVRKPMVYAGEVQEKIEALVTEGWTYVQIAEAAGLSTGGLRYIRKAKSVRGENAERIMRLGGHPTTHDLRPAWPYVRRLQSLRAAGHSVDRISFETGLSGSTVGWISTGKGEQVKRSQAEAVQAYWDKHHTDPVADPSTAVAGYGWVVPMWWDDIDDPDEQPGVSHCRDCHAPDPAPSTGWCNACRNRHYREDNWEEVRRRERERYHRQKLKEKAA